MLEQLGDAGAPERCDRVQAVDLERLGDRVGRSTVAGSSEAYGSWKTIATRRRSARRRRRDSAVTSVAVELDAPAGRLDEPQQRQPGRRLAAARLSDQPERLASVHLERRPRRRRGPARSSAVAAPTAVDRANAARERLAFAAARSRHSRSRSKVAHAGAPGADRRERRQLGRAALVSTAPGSAGRTRTRAAGRAGSADEPGIEAQLVAHAAEDRDRRAAPRV